MADSVAERGQNAPVPPPSYPQTDVETGGKPVEGIPQDPSTTTAPPAAGEGQESGGSRGSSSASGNEASPHTGSGSRMQRVGSVLERGSSMGGQQQPPTGGSEKDDSGERNATGAAAPGVEEWESSNEGPFSPSSSLSRTSATCCGLLFIGLFMFGIISELAEDGQTLSMIEDELPFSGERLVASCCADQFDAKHLKSEVDWLTTFIVSLHMRSQLCLVARQARAPPPQVLQSIALAAGACGMCSVVLAAKNAVGEEGDALTPSSVLRALAQPLASVGAAGLVKWLIYASLFNKLRYWGMLETDVDSAFTSSYVFGEFGPLNEAELPGHMLAQVKRIGGNASRNLFLVLLLALSGGRLDLVAQLALPVVAVVATFMTIPSSLVTMFMHGQRVDLFTGYLDTVEVPQGAGPGTDYNNLTWTGTANAGLEPNERQNLLLADWVFIPSMLTVLLLGVVVMLYGIVRAAACSACGRTHEKQVSRGLAMIGAPMAAAGCGAAVCCSLIAAPLLGVAATQYRDSWPEGETYLSFTEAQFSPDASRAAFEGALVPLIVLMAGLPVLGVCIALVVRLVASPEDAEAALRSNPALARASQVPGA